MARAGRGRGRRIVDEILRDRFAPEPKDDVT
jgi:hypothetical protein